MFPLQFSYCFKSIYNSFTTITSTISFNFLNKFYTLFTIYKILNLNWIIYNIFFNIIFFMISISYKCKLQLTIIIIICHKLIHNCFYSSFSLFYIYIHWTCNIYQKYYLNIFINFFMFTFYFMIISMPCCQMTKYSLVFWMNLIWTIKITSINYFLLFFESRWFPIMHLKIKRT